jgi:hypothetical protein
VFGVEQALHHHAGDQGHLDRAQRAHVVVGERALVNVQQARGDAAAALALARGELFAQLRGVLGLDQGVDAGQPHGAVAGERTDHGGPLGLEPGHRLSTVWWRG